MEGKGRDGSKKTHRNLYMFPYLNVSRRNVTSTTHELLLTDCGQSQEERYLCIKAVQDQGKMARTGWTLPAPDTMRPDISLAHSSRPKWGI